jgi:hypothetical protein
VLPFTNAMLMAGATAAGTSNPYALVNISARAQTNGAGLQSVSVAYPVGIAANDIAIIHLQVLQQISPVSLGTLPTGWAEYAHHAFNGAYHHWMLWKRLDGTESGSVAIPVSIASGTSSVRQAYMSAWGGCVTTGDPFVNKVNNEGSSANCVSGSVTTTQANQIVVNLVGRSDSPAPTFTPPAGFTEEYDGASGSGLACSLTMNHKVIASAGAVGATTTVATTSGRFGVISFGLLAV